MNIAILHDELEWAENVLADYIRMQGHTATLVDARQAKDTDFCTVDMVLNRVYASVANRNWKTNVRTLQLLGDLERSGVVCVNSALCSESDYSKFLSAMHMQENGVPTPDTLMINGMGDYSDQLETIRSWGTPLVVKRNMGGRAKDVRKVYVFDDLESTLQQMLLPNDEDGYAAGFVVQPFVESTRPYDIRIAIVDGIYSYSYSRSLVSTRANEKPWLGSGQRGSKIAEYQPTPEQIEIARQASQSIGAVMNEVDMLETQSGPLVIENNPTPGFTENKENYLIALCDSFLRSKLIAELKQP